VKKILVVFAVFGAFFLLVLSFLPVFLSSDFFLEKILARVNQLPGQHLRIENLDIGWSRGLRCDRVVYENSAQALRVHLDRIEGNRGLFALLVAPKNPGGFTLYHPVVTVTTKEKKADTNKAAQTRAGGAGKGDSNEKQAGQTHQDNADPGASLWEELTIQVEIKDGEVILANEKGQEAFPRGTVNLITSLASGTVKYNLNWRSADKGRLDAQGYVNLPAGKSHFLDTLVLKSHLVVNRFQLAPLLALASVRSASIPDGQGVLDGEITITGAGRAKLDMLGSLECTDLFLQGGFLGRDHPHIARLALAMDGGKKEDNSYHVSALTLKGDFGHLKATADYGQGRGEARAEGTLYLPFFTRQLPTLLHIDTKSSLATGEFTFTGGLTLADGKKTVHVRASADHMAGRLQGKPFSWGRAATLTLAGTSTGTDFSIENLDLKTAFASLTGKGSRDHFTLQGTVDLHKADTQLGALFALPWHGRGILNSHVEVTGGQEGGERINFVLQSKQCGLTHGKRTVLPRAPLHVQGEITLPPDWTGTHAPIDLRLDTRTWPGSISFAGTGLQLADASKKGHFSFQSDLDLARLARVLHGLEVLPGQTEIAGRMRINTDGVLAGDRLTLNDPQIKGEELVVKTGNRSFREPQLVLQGKGEPKKAQSPIAVHGLQVANSRSTWSPRQGGRIVLDLKKKAVGIHDLTLLSRIAELDVGQFAIDDLGDFLNAWHGDLKGRLDLGLAGAMFMPAQKDAQPVRPAGQLNFVLDGSQREAPYDCTLQGTIRDLRLVRSESVLYSDPAVTLALKTSGRLSGETLRIKSLRFGSAPLELKAEGNVRRGKKQLLELQGEHTFHFDQLAEIARVMTGRELVLKGDNTENFTLSLPLDTTWRDQGQLVTELIVDTFALAGIEAGSVRIPLQLNGGHLQTGINGTLNQGQLAMKALLQLGARPPLLTMPPDQKVLSDVHIDKPIADGILSRLHPLFGVLAQPSGRISATVESFSWPLSKKDRNKALFKVVFDTSEIDLVSRGVMREVLELLSVKEQQLYLKQSQVTCTCQQGRVRCSPVKVLVADSEMTISGSAGLDKSLDYLLEIPVTEKLIGREGARVLEGTVIQVPIRGTLGEPLFDRSIITDMLSSLAGQAAKKAIEKQVEKLVPGLFKGLKF